MVHCARAFAAGEALSVNRTSASSRGIAWAATLSRGIASVTGEEREGGRRCGIATHANPTMYVPNDVHSGGGEKDLSQFCTCSCLKQQTRRRKKKTVSTIIEDAKAGCPFFFQLYKKLEGARQKKDRWSCVLGGGGGVWVACLCHPPPSPPLAAVLFEASLLRGRRGMGGTAGMGGVGWGVLYIRNSNLVKLFTPSVN